MTKPAAMNSRERVLAAIDRKPVDRIPTDIWATGEVWDSLRRHFGDGVDVNAALGVDSPAGAGPRYIGPTPPEGADMWGMRSRPVENATGVYWEQCHFPLAEAKTIDDLNRYTWPSADWFDYSQIADSLREVHKTRAVQVGYMAPFYLHNLLRGFEQSLIDPLEDPELTHEMVRRITDFFVAHHRRIFEAADGLIDVTQVTDDLGSQTGPILSPALWREFYKLHTKRCIDLAKEFGIRVMHHDDGAMRPFLPDLIDLGIDVLNPVQWVCPGMEMAALKRDFGNRIAFHGGVENQRILPFGTPEEVRAEVRHCIDELASDGTGYILCPCHNLQAGTPVANILAMYDEARRYGAR